MPLYFRCVCLNDAERWTAQQLLDHAFLKPPSPKNLPQDQETSPDGLRTLQYPLFCGFKKKKSFKPSFCALICHLSDLAVDFASSVIPRGPILNAPFISGTQRQFSRYFDEFEELQLLGKGAFGAVIKVHST